MDDSFCTDDYYVLVQEMGLLIKRDLSLARIGRGVFLGLLLPV